jgi:hypothetical protein
LLTRGNSRLHDQTWIALAFLVVGLLIAREIGGRIVLGDVGFFEVAALAVAGGAAIISILRNWRVGFVFFNVALLFEDLIRKYMGNGPYLFFGKDIVAAMIYLCLFVAIRHGREKRFRPPFLLWFPLSLFVWLVALQIFNPNSPSILYGILGFKLDFFYIPMLLVGYALIRNGDDLRKFLIGNAALAIVIAGVGIGQAIVGNGFLNPGNLPIELAETANLEKVAPLSGLVFSLPNSVFVSPGRLALYLTLAATLGIGTAGYLLLSPPRTGNRKIAFASIGIVTAATVFSGSRTAVIFVFSTAVVMVFGLLWGAPWNSRRVHKIVKAITWSLVIVGFGLGLAVLLYPAEIGARVAFYAETLNPFSAASAIGYRGVTYPIQNLATAFDDENWLFGNGAGTASLGLQYVAGLLHSNYRGKWTEAGWGQLMLELGILGPVLWITWSSAMMYCCWRVVRRLRQTPLFPVAFAIVWFVFLLLFPMTFGGTSAFQSYINNAFLWLLVGVLFRLPEIAAIPEEAAAAPARRRGLPFWKPRVRTRRLFQPQPNI